LDEPAPLSFSQKRQWFLVQLEPESAAYNVPNTVYLAGELDVDALRSALGSVVERHAVLRTTFHDRDGEPYQHVAPPTASELPWIDLSDRPSSQRETEARERARAMAARPFDLAAAPPMRVELLRVAPADHRLIVVVHHIVFDGWSTGLFVQELAAFYAAEIGEGVVELPELPLQFVDYARWQRQALAGEALDRRVEAGRRRLADTPSVLELPTDHPRPIVQSHASAMVRCDLDASLERGVRELARAHGVSVFMVLLAAFGTVLGRWAMQSRFNIGTFAANRQHRELESLIGFFVNTLVLPIDLQGRPSFATLLARVRQSALAAFEHQDLPFEKLLEVVDPERHVDRSPLFQAMLVLQSFPTHRVELPDLEWRVEEIADEAGAHVDLTLWLAPTGDGLEGVLQFCPDLFEPATIEGLVERFRRLIAAAVAEPKRPIDVLPLLTPTARDAAIAHGHGPSVSETLPPAVHLAVLDVAARRGELPAVVLADGTTAWTYAELVHHVTALAGRLRALGVDAETRVGLCLERDPWMPVSILAVLTAGGAWVPVEASIPEERQRAIFEDAGVGVVLATGAGAALSDDGPWMSIDPRDAAVGEALTIEPARPSAEQAAYVIYTSGSTGKPKGVVVPHGALARFTAAATTIYGIDGDDRVLQFASPTFDTSIEEIFPCLTRGATLILRDREMLASPAGFWSRCGSLGVSVLDLPTAYWHELTAAIERGELVLTPDRAPRLVILGGERARPDALATWRAHAPPATRLVNSYGPTESTVVATAWTDDGGSIVGEVPIGTPLPGLEAHVLSPELEPVAVGVPGELCLAGTGLARGYLGLPAVTAEAFVPSPVAERPGERLYRTGDRVRRLADGDLEFLGRLDHQVKIRGFRVELGEIENVLREQPDVDDAVVIPFEATPGQPRLAAYVAAVAGDPDPVVEWISALRRRLPDYMVPMSIQRLDVLPMTSSGKVDRRALPDPDLVMLDAADDDLPPETPTEVRLAEIYAELLGVERVGVLTSFFDLGG
ncbi:MAG: amino acid adenylation domain-containing protein, partial [Acidobacteriota bacterium]